MVSAPVRNRLPVAEKYIAARTQSFTRTHARALQEWLTQRGTEDGYWADFRSRLERSEKSYQRDVDQIDNDPNMSFREKRETKNRLNRIYPSWTVEQEEAFIRTYGAPAEVDRGSLERMLENLQAPVWVGALRGGQPQDVPKHDWEMKFYDCIVNPQDGSVPLVLDARSFLQPVASAQVSAPSIAALSDDPEIQSRIEQYAKNICPICKEPQKRLNQNHIKACSQKHAPTPISINA